MARVKTARTTRARHKKVLKMAKGYYGAKRDLYSVHAGRIYAAILILSISLERKTPSFGWSTYLEF